MKTETNSMRIVKPEKTDTAGTNQQGKAPGKTKYKPVTPVMLDTVPEDAVFIRSTDVCKLLNISNSTLRNLRAERAIPFYKLGGTFLYSKEEIITKIINAFPSFPYICFAEYRILSIVFTSPFDNGLYNAKIAAPDNPASSNVKYCINC